MSALRDTNKESHFTSDKSKRKALSDSTTPAKKLKTATEEPERLDYTHVLADWPNAVEDVQRAERQALQLSYHTGDIFESAPGSVLVHACNVQGHWGAGIAKAFKQRYPNAYADHHDFCAKAHSKSSPVPTGTSQLLAPRDGDKQHWIGCAFTSARYGKGKDKPDVILRNTAKSMEMLLQLICQADGEITEIRMCKINSGKFGVPWEKTEEVLKNIIVRPGWSTKVQVWEPAE